MYVSSGDFVDTRRTTAEVTTFFPLWYTTAASGLGAALTRPFFRLQTQSMQINLTPDYSLLAIVVIFILNYFVVRKFFLQPINQVIEARETEVRSATEIYEQSMLRFQEATTQMEEKLHAARHAAADVRDRFRRDAAAYRTTVVTKTHDDANGIISEADEKLKGDVTEARKKIVTESEALAKLAAERILGRPV